MEANQVAEHLQAIRTLMERSALYRRALAPIMSFNGVVGIASGIAGWRLHIDSMRGFVLFWVSVAAVALTGSFLLVRRQALRDSEPFWSPPTKRIAQALSPPFFVGTIIGAVAFFLGKGEDTSHEIVFILGWVWLYGCAIHSAGFFMMRGIRLFAWLFIAVGSVLLIGLVQVVEVINVSPHLLMGGIFGGLHLACGIYLYFTEKRGNES